MGGILGGLIGGIAKGAAGGAAKEGERQRRQKEYVDNLITRMHINRLEDWENLSPEQQQAHTEGLIKINPHLKDVLPTGIAFAQAIGPHIEKAIGPPPIPRSEPIGGAQRPLDIPANVQDMTPAKLPAPAVVPNAPFAPPPTFEAVAQRYGMGDPNTRTPNERKLIQQEMFRQDQSERARQEALYYKQQGQQQELETLKGLGQEYEIPRRDIGRAAIKKVSGLDIAGAGSYANEGFYAEKTPDGKEITHHVVRNTKNPSMLHDNTTGTDFAQIPEGWEPAGPPRNWAPAVITQPSGAVDLLEKGGPNKGQVTHTAARGRRQFEPTRTVNELDIEGRPVQNVYTTPEAVAKSRQLRATGGGFAHPATADITKSTQGTRVLLATQRIRELTKQLQDRIGPFAGRWTDAQIKGGDLPGADPETKRLVGELDMAHSSLAAMLPKMHEFRSQKAAQEFLKVGPNWHKNPDLNMGNLDSIERLAKSFSLKDEYAPKGGNLSAPPTAGAAPKVRKYNPATGKLE